MIGVIGVIKILKTKKRAVRVLATLFALFVNTVLARTVFANTTATPTASPATPVSVTTNRVNPVTTQAKRWLADFRYTTRASSTEFSDPRQNAAMDFEMFALWRLTPKLRIDGYTAWTKGINGLRETDMQNTSFRLDQTPFKLGRHFLTRSRVGVILPTNGIERTEQKYLGSASFDQRLLFSAPFLRGLSGFYAVSAVKNFHQFNTTFEGDPLISFAVGQRLLLNYEFIPGFYVEASPRVSQRWDYQGTPSATFGLYQEIGWSNGMITVSLGHNNEGLLFRENGKDLNLSFDDPNNANYYLTLGLTL